MSTGAVPLYRYPREKVLLACRHCPKQGQYDKPALIKRVGPDASLVDLRLKIAAGWRCEVARHTLSGQHRPGYD